MPADEIDRLIRRVLGTVAFLVVVGVLALAVAAVWLAWLLTRIGTGSL